jgi:serine/threonine protein kinase
MPADFGLSRIKNESVTKISGMLGTPGWSAPEVYKQDKYTEKVLTKLNLSATATN